MSLWETLPEPADIAFNAFEQIFSFNHIVEEDDFEPAMSTMDHQLYSFNYHNADVFFDLQKKRAIYLYMWETQIPTFMLE